MVKKRRIISILGVLIGIAVLLIALGVIFRGSLLGIAANGADYVLRPLIGEENTIKVESVLFGLEDKVNQIHQTAPASADAVFNTVGVTTGQLTGKMMLTPIKALTDLKPFPNEGVWTAMPAAQFPGQEVMAKTLIHVDSHRSYAYAAIVKLDMSKLGIGTVAGIKQPGGPIGNPGVGKVPPEIADSNQLVAAFDGGFQYRDGAYGMVVDGKTYVPLRHNLATMFITNKNQASIMEYHGGPIPSNVIAIRQNGPLLVQDGQITSFTEQGKDTWGRTVTNSMYTWRSGIGVTRDGNLVYAVGPSLVPQTLALALQAAGAVNAMQLDINPYWVRFVLFNPLAVNGTYQSVSLLKNMQNGGTSYLHGYQKDFFYIFGRS